MSLEKKRPTIAIFAFSKQPALAGGSVLTKRELQDLENTRYEWEKILRKFHGKLEAYSSTPNDIKEQKTFQEQLKECADDTIALCTELENLKTDMIPIFQKVSECEDSPSNNEKVFLQELTNMRKCKMQLRKRVKEIRKSKTRLIQKSRELIKEGLRILPDESINGSLIAIIETHKQLKKVTNEWPMIK